MNTKKKIDLKKLIDSLTFLIIFLYEYINISVSYDTKDSNIQFLIMNHIKNEA